MDDGSTDGTARIAKQLATRDHRGSYGSPETAARLPRRRPVFHARGEVVVTMDGDLPTGRETSEVSSAGARIMEVRSSTTHARMAVPSTPSRAFSKRWGSNDNEDDSVFSRTPAGDVCHRRVLCNRIGRLFAAPTVFASEQFRRAKANALCSQAQCFCGCGAVALPVTIRT